MAGIWQALQCLGVPLQESSHPFGDNKLVVKSGMIPHSMLSKHHHAPACHYTREAVASKMVSFHHIGGDVNPADILSKHWGHGQVCPMLCPLLFCKGDTPDLIEIKDQRLHFLPTHCWSTHAQSANGDTGALTTSKHK